MDFEEKIPEAVHDLRYLLDRGYRKKGALKFVSDRYLLNIHERNYLARKVFSREVSLLRRKKIIDISRVKDETVFVDGYNVLITVESICTGYPSLVSCDDGFLRDVNAVFGKYRINDTTKTALTQIILLLKCYKPYFVKFLYDSPVSQSGELSKLTRNILKANNVSGDAVTSKNVDSELVTLSEDTGGIVATSDSAVIDKIQRVVDIPCEILRKVR
ncbi:DUF434 domain-containing protein [Methanobacterium aggregans]|uniref:DUF434 domain-containing protein n=1 Tax=Methanobacterium aggregans TaxID=1615586 RepID=UPI001AEA8611|nr:DUF434 domain-containing protein [Methanobacterium aggregans]MBP2046557.1 hypothetical protein [Methanobacterium aggregans]